MKDYRKYFKYNIICRLFFCWVDPLLWVGCRRSLAHSDLYPHPFECDSLYLHEKFNGYWSNELSTRGSANVRLWWVILKCFWWRSLLIQFLALLLVTVFMVQSETLGLLTDYFSLETPTPEDTNNVYIYAALLILMSAFLILLNLVFYVGRKFGGMVRILLTNAIYFKVLSLSQCTLSHVTMGHVINIASNDVHRFDECILYFPFFLVFPIHLFVVLYLLYLKVQWSSMIIVGVILVSLPVLISLSVIYSIFRFKAAKVTDRRVKVMNEIISGLRVIEVYGWEYAFSQLVCKIRREEVWDVFKGIIVKQLSVAYATRIHNLLIYVLLSVFLLTGGDLTPGIVYSVFAHTIFLRFTFSYFSQALLYLLESRVGYKRIKVFLLLPELEAFRNQCTL
ncbi:PREDICTED: multidrug resistance-associated protein 4-like isoform X2 [Amphimedon queenslandica]|uniref:ABC transmembrane type-1 domain-containing protein n=1 Tax=Amphimedon queenslandica TaxID=400682 RepID=A0AAN0JAA1_AMPQE|nr:PREDICTED: multidrug resistance-associated protein 4-like isoform X2 [Amphimedon queenslandica]|eukprot:XP_019853687.1 PREDICTED: multidrug resistance-associated protein 4-like isoform X2 [Amphimedon queenslandica]